MRHFFLGLAAVFSLFEFALGHDVVLLPGGGGAVPPTGGTGSAKWELFDDPLGIVTVTGVTQTANGTVGCPGAPSCVAQFNLSRGFKGNGPGANNGLTSGILLTDFCGRDLPGHATAYGACAPTAAANGGIPSATTAGFCSGFDPVLSAALGGVSGPSPYPNSDAAILEVNFTMSVASTRLLTYTFGTYETPPDPSFANAFGIWLDGTLLAGGDSNSGPVAGTDAWTLVPSDATPPEFNTAPNAAWVVPAVTTGQRTIVLSLSAGTHVLRASVADNGPAVTTPAPCAPATPGACNIVGGFLALGVGLSADTAGVGGVCGNLDFGYRGHPASGGTYSDFQFTVSGAPPGGFAFLALAASLPPISGSASIPIAGLPNPCGLPALTLSVDPSASLFLIVGPFPVSTSGTVAWPNPPISVPGGLDGTRFTSQWFAVSSALDITNARTRPGGPMAPWIRKGLLVEIGPP